jgi:hypothetical protein
MAFTLRTDREHDDKLDKLCQVFQVKTKNKAVLRLIEDYELVVNQRNSYREKAEKRARDLALLKRAVQDKIAADNALSGLFK